MAALIALAIQSGVRAAVVFDNLGPAPYTTVGYATFGLYSDSIYYDRGMQFTAAQTVILTNLQLALGEAHFTSGNAEQSGTAKIQLLTDSASTPGTVLETWTSATISGGPQAGGVLSFNSVLKPKLTAGSKYWVVLSAATGSNLGGAWYFADDNHTGNTLTLWRNNSTGTPSYTTLTRGYRTLVSGDSTGPKLSIAVSGNNVKIFWTTNTIGGTLQGKSSLSQANTWANIGTGTIVSNQYVVTEPIGTAPKFYRLAQ
ncbi:MAG: hypothetical protein JWO95_2661 [Verrucomicrobiales bacterium]|nr:hypothetical protein [Verrucomicrobiales bacterium]